MTEVELGVSHLTRIMETEALLGEHCSIDDVASDVLAALSWLHSCDREAVAMEFLPAPCVADWCQAQMSDILAKYELGAS